MNDSIQEIEKRLSYAENNNLFDAHYINDMKTLIKYNKRILMALSQTSNMLNYMKKRFPFGQLWAISEITEHEKLINNKIKMIETISNEH